MKIHQKKYPSGLTIQAIEMPGTNVITTLILAGAGSRYETKEISGISHFLEHMFFKGAKKYTTPKAVSEAIDSFGGEFNAFTGKEYAGYYVKSGQENLSKSLDVLSDMLLHSKFDVAEIEKERGVILEEMAMYLDAPMYQISWDFEQLVFGDQPLGWDQIGTKELIKTVSQEDFIKYKNNRYVGENMVITVAGAVNEKTIDQVAAAFPCKTEKLGGQPKTFDRELATHKFKIRQKKTEQYHVSFGVRTLAETDPAFPALKVLGVVLGGNMSSRMFQNIREDKGLCYSIRTVVDEFSDTGLLTTRAGVKLDDVLRAAEAIREEYDLIAKGGITDEELRKAQNYILGKTDLKTEDTEEVAHHFAKDALLYKKVETLDDWKDRIRNVQKSDVDSLAKTLFAPESLRFAGIGPELDEDALQKIIG